ncbi:hypothetical protein FXW78_29030 [Rhodococcus opacus]|nr:hypothetical protein [Rhodococcus opacus]
MERLYPEKSIPVALRSADMAVSSSVSAFASPDREAETEPGDPEARMRSSADGICAAGDRRSTDPVAKAACGIASNGADSAS